MMQQKFELKKTGQSIQNFESLKEYILNYSVSIDSNEFFDKLSKNIVFDFQNIINIKEKFAKIILKIREQKNIEKAHILEFNKLFDEIADDLRNLKEANSGDGLLWEKCQEFKNKLTVKGNKSDFKNINALYLKNISNYTKHCLSLIIEKLAENYANEVEVIHFAYKFYCQKNTANNCLEDIKKIIIFSVGMFSVSGQGDMIDSSISDVEQFSENMSKVTSISDIYRIFKNLKSFDTQFFVTCKETCIAKAKEFYQKKYSSNLGDTDNYEKLREICKIQEMGMIDFEKEKFMELTKKIQIILQ